MFEVLPHLAPDPILGLSAAFREDTNPNKIDLGVGVYKDEQGNTPILSSVAKAQQVLLDTETSKTYITPQGNQGFIDGMLSLLLGKNLEFPRYFCKDINTLYCLFLSQFFCTNIRLHSKKNYYVFSQNASNKQNVD